MFIPIVDVRHFAGAEEALASLKPGTKLSLAHEPDNPYDINAIKVLLPDTDGKTFQMLGYIPRAHASVLAPALGAGWTPTVSFLSGNMIQIENPDFIYQGLGMERSQ